MKVHVKIEVDDSRKFTITIGVPPTSSLLLSEAGVEKGSGTPNTEKVGNIDFQQCVKVAKMKKQAMLAIDLRSAVKEVVGTCVSIGLTVNEEEPKKIIEDINTGVFDEFF
jgi:large subunit ribosomal protein L11